MRREFGRVQGHGGVQSWRQGRVRKKSLTLMGICLCVLKLLQGDLFYMDILYMDRSRIIMGRLLSIFRIKLLTCACAFEFCNFLEKYSTNSCGLNGFERKLSIAYPNKNVRRVSSLVSLYINKISLSVCVCVFVTLRL